MTQIQSSPGPAGPAAYEAPFRRVAPRAQVGLVLIADHASSALPAAYGSLGLPKASFGRHIACDLGIAELTESLAGALGAAAILAGFSRLLIDPNRGEDDPTLIMQLSDGEIIPGNAHIGADETKLRLKAYHRPYHEAIDQELNALLAAGLRPLIVSMHSFTPSWRGKARPWHCGVLWAGDPDTAAFCLSALRHDGTLAVGDNQPYSGALEGDTLDRHGTKRAIAHVLIEVRQDLIASAPQRDVWTARLSQIFSQLVTRNRAAT